MFSCPQQKPSFVGVAGWELMEIHPPHAGSAMEDRRRQEFSSTPKGGCAPSGGSRENDREDELMLCRDCHLYYSDRIQLENHVCDGQSLHYDATEKQRIFLCNLCPKSFRTRYALNQHHGTSHGRTGPSEIYVLLLCTPSFRSLPVALTFGKAGAKKVCAVCQQTSFCSHSVRDIEGTRAV